LKVKNFGSCFEYGSDGKKVVKFSSFEGAEGLKCATDNWQRNFKSVTDLLRILPNWAETEIG